MWWARWSVFSAIVTFACGNAAQTAKPPKNEPIPLSTPTESEPTSEPGPSAPAPEPEAPAPGSVVSVKVHPDKPPCTLEWKAGQFKDEGDWFLATGVERIETREGGACRASVLYDLAAESKNDPEAEGLVGGVIPKPGSPKREESDESSCRFEDLSFDGFADLCVVQLTGAYNYSQRCFVFDPVAKTFVANNDLSQLIYVAVDQKKKRLTTAHRVGGPQYTSGEYGWEQGKLVPFLVEDSTLGERPDGKPLPPGFSSYVVRHERKKGRLVKTFEGPVRQK